VKNGLITVSEIRDVSKSRLVAQVDIKDGVTQLINYNFNEVMQANVPEEMVSANGADQGIRHSFRFTEDAFATGDDKRLVNHKTYYFMAIAYGYNEFKHYNPMDPASLDGQTQPYIASRKLAGGRGISSFSAIPHNTAPENGGTMANSEYGDMPQITRIEGQGNGGNQLEITAASEAAIVANNYSDKITYHAGYGPIQVKVIDPLNVQAGVYTVKFKDTLTTGNLTDAFWTLYLPTGDSVSSDQTIAIENEQIFLDQGLSVTIQQVSEPGVNVNLGNGLIGADVSYQDISMTWLGGYADGEGQHDGNWIRSGTSNYDVGDDKSAYNDNTIPPAGEWIDPEQYYENLVNKTWAPYGLLGYVKTGAVPAEVVMQDAVAYSKLAVEKSSLADLASVDIVFTTDKSKWTRSMVLEARNDVILSQGSAGHLELRAAPSVDKNGRKSGDSGYNPNEGDIVSTTGMGWFPGYAIDLETGDRLNRTLHLLMKLVFQIHLEDLYL
jgi:hypothetical protein